MSGTLYDMKTGHSHPNGMPRPQEIADADQTTCVANVKHDNAKGKAKVANPARFCRDNPGMSGP